MILIPDGVILIPQRSPKGRLLSATFLNMLLVPIFTDVGQILLQPTPSSVWRGASKRMRRPRSARIGGNTREGGRAAGGWCSPSSPAGSSTPLAKFLFVGTEGSTTPKLTPRHSCVRHVHHVLQRFPANMLPGKTHTRQPFVKHSLMGQVLTIKH